MKKILLLISLLANLQLFAQTDSIYSNCIAIKNTDSEQTIINKASHVVPTQRQYEWQKMEFTGFIHFGINTFTGREWGTGKESTKLFTPTNLDAKQWVKVAKSAGIKLVMLTAKHHDGFCLWQTNTTPHSVKNSPWQKGKGDVLRELAKAAKKADLKVGVYLSPADLHEIERKGGTYGNGSKAKMRQIPSDPTLQAQADTIFSFLLDDYNTLFMNQLYEVLTKYGEISEVWFDGANPKSGTGQKYDYKAWYGMIRQLQPNAVIAIKGPDVRWIGNEAGHSRENEWSVIPLETLPENATWKDRTDDDLGSREKLKSAKYLYWYPAETDTPIRKGWFYKDEQQSVKTVDKLLDIWYRSVGNNSVLLLNISPNKQGRIPQKDSLRMQQLGRIIEQSFATNLLEKAQFGVSKNIVDENLEKSILLKGKDTILTFEFDETQEFNRFVIQEDIKSFGQRIEDFSIAIWHNSQWKTIYQGGTVGYKKIARFPMQKAQKIRLKINKSRNIPSLGFVGLYKAPELLSTPKITRDKNGKVSIQCQTPDPIIYYTLDQSTPNTTSLQYTQPFYLPKGGTIKAIASIQNGKKQSDIQEVRLDICPKKWRVLTAANFAKGFGAENAIDANTKTLWHTPWNANCPKFPHSITIDLGEELTVNGMTYLPRQDGSLAGVCTDYEIKGSLNGKEWQLLANGTFENIRNNPVLQQVRFAKTPLRFLQFTAFKSIDNKPYLSVAELGILTK